MDTSVIGKVIAYKRKEKHMTQEALAQKTGCYSQDNISLGKWIHLTRYFTVDSSQQNTWDHGI